MPPSKIKIIPNISVGTNSVEDFRVLFKHLLLDLSQTLSTSLLATIGGRK